MLAYFSSSLLLHHPITKKLCTTRSVKLWSALILLYKNHKTLLTARPELQDSLVHPHQSWNLWCIMAMVCFLLGGLVILGDMEGFHIKSMQTLHQDSEDSVLGPLLFFRCAQSPGEVISSNVFFLSLLYRWLSAHPFLPSLRHLCSCSDLIMDDSSSAQT